jgi:hypothetical protein
VKRGLQSRLFLRGRVIPEVDQVLSKTFLLLLFGFFENAFHPILIAKRPRNLSGDGGVVGGLPHRQRFAAILPERRILLWRWQAASQRIFV